MKRRALPVANRAAMIPARHATSDFACATTPFFREEQMQRTIVLVAVFGAALAMLTSTSFVRGQTAATAAPQTQTGAIATTSTSEHFDPAAATNAYLAKVPPDKKAKSDAYFEGGYWLILWDFLASSIVFLLLLVTGLSARPGRENHAFQADPYFPILGPVPGAHIAAYIPSWCVRRIHPRA
jgi:hypothetical protein